MIFLLCTLGIALKAACLFYVYAVWTTLSGYQDVLTFTFFSIKIFDSILLSFKWLCTV